MRGLRYRLSKLKGDTTDGKVDDIFKNKIANKSKVLINN